MNEDFLFYNGWFDKKYGALSGLRWPTMKAALNLFLQRKGELIVETGTMRLSPNWGDGCSTLLFGEFCKKYNKHMVTVDISPENIAVSKEQTKEFSAYIEYVVENSLNYFHKLSSHIKIGLLYLDSMDCPVDVGETDLRLCTSQKHNLNEMVAAMPHMTDDSIVLLDDSGMPNGGKPKETKKYLMENNWVCVYDYYQSLWIRK